MANNTNATCPCCDEKGILTCMGCKNVRYCSKECQETDWPVHKVLCRAFKEVGERPAENMHLAIFFPPNEVKPELVWLPVSRGHDEAMKPWEALEIEEKMGKRPWMINTIKKNEITGVSFDSDYLIMLCYDDKFLMNYSAWNAAARAATGGNSVCPMRGPVLAYRSTFVKVQEYDEGSIMKAMDMDMASYSHVIAYMIDYENHTQAHIFKKGPKIHAVKILCDSELRLCGGARCQQIKIPRQCPVLHSDHKGYPDVSKLIGMHLSTLKTGFSHQKQELNLWNRLAAVMHIGLNPEEDSDTSDYGLGFGSPAAPWNRGMDSIGSVIFLRQDLQPLSVDTAEAFAAFSSGVKAVVASRPIRAVHDVRGRELTGRRLSAAEVIAEITPEKWEAFLREWREDKIAVVNKIQRDSWGDADSLIRDLSGMKITYPAHERYGIAVDPEEDVEDVSSDE